MPQNQKFDRAPSKFSRQSKSTGHTNQEIEIKLRVPDRPALLRHFTELGAKFEGRVHEGNTLFDTPSRGMMKSGKLLRIRTEKPASDAEASSQPAVSTEPGPAVLTFKGPVRRGSKKSPGARRYKVREEHEIRVSNGHAAALIFESLGLRPSFRYEKYRSTYRLPAVSNVVVELDETPIGDFLELEGARSAISRAAALLGYAPADFITKSYGELFIDKMRRTRAGKRQRRGRLSASGYGDMLFHRKK